jgi:hypothetical protein
MTKAIGIAQNLFPNWDYLPSNVQAALADMAFNMGNNLGDFTRLQNDIAVMDFAQAADDIAKTRWAAQVGVRADRDEALLTLDEQLLEQYEDIGDIIDQLMADSPDFSTPTDSSDTGTDPATPTAPDDGIDFTPDDVTPDAVTPVDVTPDAVTPDAVTPDNGTPDAGTETRVHLNDPEGWQVGIWYERVQPTVGPGYYVVSEDQDPTHSAAQGVFARYEGNNQWSVYGSSSQPDDGIDFTPDAGTPDAGTPDDGIDFTPDAGTPDAGTPPLGSHENPFIDDESIEKTPDGFQPADGFDVVHYYQDDNGFWHVRGEPDPGDPEYTPDDDPTDDNAPPGDPDGEPD